MFWYLVCFNVGDRKIEIHHLFCPVRNKTNELGASGLIQRFEYTLQLSWKVLKDDLEEKGFVFKPSPKDKIREAQQSGLIQFEHKLIDGLNIRNEGNTHIFKRWNPINTLKMAVSILQFIR